MENLLAILGKIGFDWQVAFANLVNFLIIFFLLKKFAFGPLEKVIRERKKKISDGIENAKRAETELFMAENIRNEKIAEAKKEANTIIGDAQQKGDEIVAESKAQAEDEKASIVASGEREVREKKEAIKKELETETADLVIGSLEKVLRESFDDKSQKDYIKKILAN